MKSKSLRSTLGGGVFLFVTILIVSIFWVVPKGTVHATETTVINGVEYETIELTDDYVSNWRKINQSKDNPDRNYRYVMTANVVYPENSSNVHFYGNAVIYDFNGYTIDMTNYGGALCFESTTAEVMDSSVAGTGGFITATARVLFATGLATKNTQTLTISGGHCDNGKMHFYTGDVIFKGGNYQNADPDDGQHLVWCQDLTQQKITVAPWLETSYLPTNIPDQVIGLNSVRPYDNYAVSNTALVSGAYNTAYGLAWNLDVRTLLELTVPTNKTYYLWARNADGRYTYLNLRYDHDQQTWVAA